MLADVAVELAGEPGGAALHDLVARVDRVDPAAVLAFGDRVRGAGHGLAGSVRGLMRGAATADAEWQGPSADAFAGWLAAFARAGTHTTEITDRVGDELAAVARTLQGLRDEVAVRASEALDAARVARLLASGAPPSVADRLAAEAMAGPTAGAQAAVARVEGELATAAGTLAALAGGLTAFAALSAPDGAAEGPGVVVPRPGPPGPPGPSGPPGPDAPLVPPLVPHPGGVDDWIGQATAILAARGVPTDRMNPHDIATIIDRESGGDPNAVNGWDSNAAGGTPSQGLMQTIGPTFRTYALPGHGDIRNPVDNIIAGVRYAIARYGSVSHVPGVVALAHGHHYVGY